MGSNHQGADRAGNPREPPRCGQKKPHMRTQARNHTYTPAYTHSSTHARTCSFPVPPSSKDTLILQETKPESSPSERVEPPALPGQPAAMSTDMDDMDNGVDQKEPVKKQLFEESRLSPSPVLPLDALAPRTAVQEPVKEQLVPHAHDQRANNQLCV